ncbi:PEGA domain protein [Leptospira ryugenii]|uniref:PEGA domain protein n=1 Tax=Leptospira ryugenii TaxID=1917863 RepID=A0A2P2E1X6_9LEPT|nr:PEGA domain-containing protein [Leptospira ryugenii]GBF50859.1 PEGA domain protein [Leptospira ryugenii]
MRFSFVFCFFLLISCASVTQIETNMEVIPRPEYKDVVLSNVEPLPSSLDFRERIQTKIRPSFVIQWNGVTPSTKESDLRFIEDKIITSHRKFGDHFRTPMGSNLEKEALKAKDIDLILKASLQLEKDFLKVNLEYLDSVSPQSYGSKEFGFKFISEREISDNVKSLEVYHKNNQLVPLSAAVKEYWSEVFAPTASEIQTILESSMKAQVSFYSTSPGTNILLDGKEIGKAPLVDFPLINGKHRLAFSKPGKDPVERSILVRGGKKTRIFHEWNDDISQGTIFVTSYPSGLSVSVSGQNKGNTQYVEAGVPYGNYPIQFLRTTDKDSFEYAKASVQVLPKSLSHVSLPFGLEEGVSWEAEDFWFPSGGSPHFQTNFTGSLQFQKQQDLPNGWYGVYSQNIIPDKMKSNFVLGLSKDTPGRLAVSFTDGTGKCSLLVVDKTDFHLIQYASGEKEAKVSASYRWKSEDPEKGRTISFETDPEKQILKVYLGSSLVLEKPWSFQTLWQFAILTPSQNFLSGKPLRSLKIRYPDMLSFEEKLKK